MCFLDMFAGLHFIESNFTSINDHKQHHPIGFDILFPSLVEYAQTLGINLPIRPTSLEAMIQKRDAELQRYMSYFSFCLNSASWLASNG